MKLIINDKEYDLTAGLANADLYTLFELKSRHGIGMKSILEAARSFEHLEDPMELLDDADSFKVFLAIIWLARRHAGEKLTLEEASSVPLTELLFVQEEGDDDQPVPPPSALTASGQGGKPRKGKKASRGTSRTSKSQS